MTDTGDELPTPGASVIHDEPEASSASVPSPPTRPLLSRANSAVSVTGWDTPNRPHIDELLSGLSLFDALVSLQAHLDLFNRQLAVKRQSLKQRSGDWRRRSQQIVPKLPEVGKVGKVGQGAARKLREELRKYADGSDTGKGEGDDVEELVMRVRKRMSTRVKVVVDKWNDATVVSLREKISFWMGVQNLLITSLVLGLHPQWIPALYTVQALYFLPLRFFIYKRRLWNYFLADFCYAMNLLTLIFLWVAPGNVVLFEACYGLSHGPLATAIATWRNVLVFHDMDKVTSLFVHIYPPLVFTTLRHYYPNAEERYPALSRLTYLEPWKSIFICSFIYLIWQLLYYRFIIVARREKIQKGGRITSFTYLVNDKKGPIGKILRKIAPEHREPSFMAAQFVYTVVTILPSIFLLYQSKFWSGIYLWVFFSFSVWNGAAFYLQVLFRRYEKQIMELKQEVDDLNRQLSASALAANLAAGSDAGDLDTFSSQNSPGGSQPGGIGLPTPALGAEGHGDNGLLSKAMETAQTVVGDGEGAPSLLDQIQPTGDGGAGRVESPKTKAVDAEGEGEEKLAASRTQSEKSFGTGTTGTDEEFELVKSRGSSDGSS